MQFTFEVDLVKEILNQILKAAKILEKRFSVVRSPEDFVISEQGLEKLDAICMQLIAIGESVKNVDKITRGELLINYPEVPWKQVMGMRDILSHHYFDMDAEVVYTVCSEHIPILIQILEKILLDIEKS